MTQANKPAVTLAQAISRNMPDATKAQQAQVGKIHASVTRGLKASNAHRAKAASKRDILVASVLDATAGKGWPNNQLATAHAIVEWELANNKVFNPKSNKVDMINTYERPITYAAVMDQAANLYKTFAEAFNVAYKDMGFKAPKKDHAIWGIAEKCLEHKRNSKRKLPTQAEFNEEYTSAKRKAATVKKLTDAINKAASELATLGVIGTDAITDAVESLGVPNTEATQPASEQPVDIAAIIAAQVEAALANLAK